MPNRLASGNADPAHRALVSQVDAARQQARQLLLAQSELAWRNWVYGDPLDLAGTYPGHEALFSPTSIARVRLLEQQTADPQERRALTFLRVYLSGEVLGRQTATLADQVATLEARASFTADDGSEHAYRELDRLIAGTADHGRRLSLYRAALPVIRQLNPLLQQKEDLILSLLPEVGATSYQAFATQLREVNLAQLGETADRFLSVSEALYRTAIDRQLRRELGLGLAETRRADIPRFNRSADLDGAFPSDSMLPRLRETLAGLGIDLAHQTNVRIDDAPLPNKNPRAVCFNVVVPTDIRLSVKPVGGVTDYHALFHEAGHAEHYAHTRSPRFEFQQLGDNAVTESYAFLFEGLMEDPLWLADHTNLSGRKLTEFVRSATAKKLLLVRRYAGKLLFELGWHAGEPNPRAVYQAQLSRAYGFPLSDDDSLRYLVDHDDFFYAADYFRAWFLAAQLQDKLARSFGARWWNSTPAGDFLKSLWAEGNGLTVDEVAQRLGAAGLDQTLLLQRFQTVLGDGEATDGGTPAIN